MSTRCTYRRRASGRWCSGRASVWLPLAWRRAGCSPPSASCSSPGGSWAGSRTCGMDDPAVVESRRKFLSRISLGLSALAGAVVSVPILAYLLSPLLRPAPRQWKDLGLVENFRIGETVEVAFDEPSPLPWAGQTARSAVWLRRTGDQEFTAFALNCTHLGCPVNWRPDA